MSEGLVWVVLILAAVITGLVAHFTITDDWRKRGLYVWRTRKPHAFLGLPIIGRHFAYTGMTGNRLNRDRQHLFGTAYDPPAPWSDLSPKPYPLPCLLPGWEFARKVQEKLWILILFPVYNVHWNTHNPRRITRSYAYTLKQRRQAGGRRFNMSLALARAPLSAGLIYALWHWGPSWIS
jgi:hypothetical protein